MTAEHDMEKGKYIVWHKRYSVGNEILDSQHKEMFDVINTLYADISTETKHIDIKKIFRYLYQYANIHFREEENAMQACAYPELFPHKIMHWLYVRKIDYFMKQFLDANIDIQYSLLPFLKNWLKYHILNVDQRYISYLKTPEGKEYTRKQSERQEQNKSREQGPNPVNSTVKDEKYYAEILGLDALITKDNIKKAYHQKVKEYHPDHVANLGFKIRMLAEEEMEKINEAFTFLMKKYGP